jgi:hypothetical protein
VAKGSSLKETAKRKYFTDGNMTSMTQEVMGRFLAMHAKGDGHKIIFSFPTSFCGFNNKWIHLYDILILMKFVSST